jgi:hypothetical protein
MLSEQRSEIIERQIAVSSSKYRHGVVGNWFDHSQTLDRFKRRDFITKIRPIQSDETDL